MGKPNVCLDADVRARIHESHERAKFVLEASKRALDAQSEQLGKRGGPGRLDITNLFGHQSYTLAGSKDDRRNSTSPRPSFAPVQDDMQSTRKSIATEEDPLPEPMPRNAARNRSTLTAIEMSNKTGARAVPANMNNTNNTRDLSVSDIFANSRSDRVRRMSQVPESRKQANNTAMAIFERDENEFIAEIPAGFQAQSPPTCLTPKSRLQVPGGQQSYSRAAKIPIELDDFGGEGYLLGKYVSHFILFFNYSE